MSALRDGPESRRAALNSSSVTKKVMNKTELLNKIARTPDERLFLSRLSDKLEAARRGMPACTGFLSAAEQETAERFFRTAGHPRHLFAGGWPDAERKVCALLPDWQEPDDWQPPYLALRGQWQSDHALTHRDILGAVLGQGLEREKVGDILIHPHFCDFFVFQELASYLLQNLTGAGRAKLHLEEIPLNQVETPTRNVKQIHDTVSSLRLDAVMAAGFSTSRGKSAEYILNGRVERNHRPCLKPDQAVEEGDVLTCRGLGKCVVQTVGGTSKKGRIILTLERYL